MVVRQLNLRSSETSSSYNHPGIEGEEGNAMLALKAKNSGEICWTGQFT